MRAFCLAARGSDSQHKANFSAKRRRETPVVDTTLRRQLAHHRDFISPFLGHRVCTRQARQNKDHRHTRDQARDGGRG